MPADSTRRALVLARGLGTRMRQRVPDVAVDDRQAAAADAGVKAMIPFGRPFLDFVLHRLADAGVHEVALVLGPEHEAVRDYYRRLRTARIRVTFVEQAQPLGTADAVLSARGWAGDRPFLVLNADNLYPVHVLAALVEGAHPAVPGFEAASLGLPIERLAAFALLGVGADGALVSIAEKPGEEAVRKAGSRALVSVNLWRFDGQIFEPCREVPLSARGERELPQAVGLGVSRGVRFEVFAVRGAVLDLSRRVDIPTVASALEGVEVSL